MLRREDSVNVAYGLRLAAAGASPNGHAGRDVQIDEPPVPASP